MKIQVENTKAQLFEQSLEEFFKSDFEEIFLSIMEGEFRTTFVLALDSEEEIEQVELILKQIEEF